MGGNWPFSCGFPVAEAINCDRISAEMAVLISDSGLSNDLT